MSFYQLSVPPYVHTVTCSKESCLHFIIIPKCIINLYMESSHTSKVHGKEQDNTCICYNIIDENTNNTLILEQSFMVVVLFTVC